MAEMNRVGTALSIQVGLVAFALLLSGGMSGPTSGRPQTQTIGLGQFSPAVTPAKYERDRDYDLKHVSIHLKLNWPQKTFQCKVVETLSPLREGLTSLRFDAGPDLQIFSCS